jgi:hypothetical protein
MSSKDRWMMLLSVVKETLRHSSEQSEGVSQVRQKYQCIVQGPMLGKFFVCNLNEPRGMLFTDSKMYQQIQIE